jgi:hypothetical protein
MVSMTRIILCACGHRRMSHELNDACTIRGCPCFHFRQRHSVRSVLHVDEDHQVAADVQPPVVSQTSLEVFR